MRYYTETIPNDLGAKLEKAGMPIDWVDDSLEEQPIKAYHCETMYCEIFDWLMERGIDAEVALSRIIDVKNEGKKRVYFWTVGSLDNINYECGENDNMTWHEAANAAIEKALTLI